MFSGQSKGIDTFVVSLKSTLDTFKNTFASNFQLAFTCVKNQKQPFTDVLQIPASIYLFKVTNKSTRKKCEICSKLSVQTPERHQWPRSGVFIVTLNVFHIFF